MRRRPLLEVKVRNPRCSLGLKYENASGLVSPHSTLVRPKRLEESFPASQREMGRDGAPTPTRNGCYRGPFQFKRAKIAKTDTMHAPARLRDMRRYFFSQGEFICNFIFITVPRGIPSAHMHWASISDLATLGMWADPGSYA